jgi:hypothetical protein
LSWAAPVELPPASDTIDAYLDEPPIPISIINAAGSPMKYWYAQKHTHPTVSLMAMDFI